MRPLAVLVLAEFLVIVLLAALWLGSAPSIAGTTAAAPPPPPAADVPVAHADAQVPKPTPAPIERLEAPPAIVDIAADDPLGILVTGSIRSSDGTPIEGASVYFSRDRDYRSGDGALPGVYAAAGLSPGEWKVTCRAEGFGNFESTCNLDARAFQQFDIELRPSYVVRVKLVDADGNSIVPELAKKVRFGLPYVVATEAPLAGDLPPTLQTRLIRFGLGEWRGLYDAGQEADPKLREQGYCGELRMDRPPPAFAALLVRTTLLQSQRIEPGQQELVFTMALDDVLAKLGTVKLRLVDAASGEPIAGVVVRISTAQGGGSGGKTGEDGRATLTAVLPGLGTLGLMPSKERESLTRYVRVPAGGTVDLGDIALTETIKVTGLVVDASGKPVNGASVQWTELDCRSFPQPLFDRRSTSADADGKFQLWGCGRHRYVVFARNQDGGFGYATVDASAAVTPFTIALASRTAVALHANFGMTVGYLVTALDADHSPVAVATLGTEYRPDSMPLLPGTYTIEITDLVTDQLVRRFPLQVGSEPTSIEVP